MNTLNHGLLCLLVCFFLIDNTVLSATTPNKTPTGPTLFQLAPDDISRSSAISEGVYLKIAPATLQQIVHQKKKDLTIQLPLDEDNQISLQLSQKQILPGNFQVIQQSISEKATAGYTPGVYYHGKVNGYPNSLVAISFFEDKIMGVISYNGYDYNLGLFTDASKTEEDIYVLFPESNLLQPKDFVCHTPDDPIDIPDDLGTSGVESVTGNSAKVYFECDYQMYLDNGSSVSATTDFVTAMFNVVAAVYAVDNICVEISQIFVWTTNDPYPSSSSDAALNAFQNQLNGNFNGDVAHLLSTVNANNGGLAYVDVLCGNSSISIGYSNIDDGYSNLPNYSWTVGVVAHELGHNFGSPHTHSCYWPGGAIDNCFCPEGSCDFGPEPAATGGTVMSYCHLGGGTFGSCTIPTPNPGMNLNAGFGPLPATLIFNNIENAGCLTACGNTGGSSLVCAGAVELFNEVTYNGNTSQGNANISTYGCGNYDESGNEVVHFFTAPISGVATITYNENAAGNIDLFVLGACNPNSCLYYFAGGMGIVETIDISAGQTYYLVTDVLAGGAGGAYDITISFPDGACQCDNPMAITCDNFEPYTTGTLGPQSACWTTWSGSQGGLEDGWVSTEQAFSGSNALKVEGGANGGPQDVVFLPGNYTAGHYQLSFKLYIPSGKAAYYNIQHLFTAGSVYEWASDVFFNTNGTGQLNAGVENAATFSYTQGAWIDVVQNIDIDGDQTTLTIGGTIVHTWPFSYQSNSTTGGTNALAAVDFYPLDENYLYYIDDIELIEVGGAPILTLSPGNQNVDPDPGNTSFSVSSNIDWSVSDNASWLTVTPANSTGTGSIIATFEENTTTSARTATISLSGSGLTQTATLTQAGFVPPAIVVSHTVTNETCYNQGDATIDLQVGGGIPGYSFTWNNGATTEDLTNVSPGVYSCTIVDSDGASQSTGDITVTAAPEISAIITTPGSLNCAQSEVFINATNSIYGSGVSTTWTTTDGNITSGANTLTLFVNAPGTYTLTLMYNNDPNCISTASVIVEQIPAMQGAISSTVETGQNADGTATVTASQGTAPYTYSWNTTPVQTDATATGLSAGFYQVTVTDQANCTLVLSIDVEQVTSTTNLPGLEQFEVFPNPTSGQVNVLLSFDKTEKADLCIYDVLGRKVWNKSFETQQLKESIDLSDLPGAVYMVTIVKGTMQSTKRLVLYK